MTAILSNQITYNLQTFKDGKLYDPLMEMIAPGLFLVLFYFIVATFGGQMMNAVVEEKENRVSEMILTTIRARTLIVGKIFAFMVLILIQMLVIINLILLAYLLLGSFINLPSFDLSSIPFDASRILTGLLIFVASLSLFSGLLVAIGAAMPTAKEAGQFFSIPMVLLFAPLYITPMLMAGITNPAITFITYFPFTAPVTLLLRNAVGTLEISELIIGVVILAVSAVVVFIIAARLFQTGAVEYTRRMSLKGVLVKKK